MLGKLNEKLRSSRLENEKEKDFKPRETALSWNTTTMKLKRKSEC